MVKLRLKYWRTRKALTIDELSAKAGMSTQTIVNLEKNRQPPRASTIRRLAEALEVTVDELIEDVGEPDGQPAQVLAEVA